MRFVFVLGVLVSGILHAGDSPQFRGPDGEGHSEERDLPIQWSATENVAWFKKLDGLGWSTPSIAATQIWMTTSLNEGKSLRALCLDKKSGELLRDVEIFQHDDPGSIHKKNSYASPSVLIEQDMAPGPEGNKPIRLYVHFGNLGTACLNPDGEIVWKKRLNYNHRHGPGGSPILVDDLLIISCDGIDVQYVTALNKLTGEEVWKTERKGAMAYSTPLLIEVNGERQVVSTGGEWVMGYAPKSGKELWRFQYPAGYSNVPRPVFGHGLVFVCSGYNKPFLYAVRPDGSGDVTQSHMAWKIERGAPLNPSPLLVGEELYIVSDNGIISCLNAKTGDVHWQERVGGNFSASPLYAEGRIYLLDENGKTFVIAASKEKYEDLAVNELPGRTLASIASADKSLFLRTSEGLYRLQVSK